MDEHFQTLSSSVLASPIIWKNGYPYFIHPLTDGVPKLDHAVLKAVVRMAAERISWDGIDTIVGIEAMGLPLTAPLSIEVNKPLCIVRKRSYGLDGEICVDQSTGYSKGAMFINDIHAGEQVAIVDDVISTGGTLRAVINGIQQAGGIILDILTIVEKGDGMKILQLEFPNIQFQSLVRIDIKDGKVIILD